MQRRLTKEEKSNLFLLFETGKYTAKDLSVIFPITSVAISALLKRHGYISPSQSVLQRKYAISENFFDVIDSQEKAYILGLLYADGYNNTDRGSVNLSLKESDREILDKISMLIQPKKPLQFIKINNKRKGFENSENQYRLVMANKHISEALMVAGCGKAKTHILKFPGGEILRSGLERHFIRGYFDGDGCISVGKAMKIDICGTIDFLQGIQRILFKELFIKPSKLNKRYKDRDNSIRSLQISGRNQIKRFMDWIYKDSNIHLKRKFERFNAAINIKNQGIKIPGRSNEFGDLPVEDTNNS